MEVRDSVLTCKSLVQARFSGERPIEPPGSWFHPKSSSEELKPIPLLSHDPQGQSTDEHWRVKLMIRVFGYVLGLGRVYRPCACALTLVVLR